MGLRISNKATDKQKAMLKKFDYIGTGKYSPDNLTVQEAAELIDELIVEQRLMDKDERQEADWD